MIPKKFFLTKGVGIHKDRLQSFELALRNAGIEICNIVHVSSILPPYCKMINKSKGLKQIKPGQITYCVISQNSTNEPHRLISAAIGIAVPAEETVYGYISEYHSYGEKEKEAGDYVEDLAATMLATTLGIDFDVDKAWDEKKEVYKASGKIFETISICQTAQGKKNHWVTVIAVAVFIEE